MKFMIVWARTCALCVFVTASGALFFAAGCSEPSGVVPIEAGLDASGFDAGRQEVQDAAPCDPGTGSCAGPDADMTMDSGAGATPDAEASATPDADAGDPCSPDGSIAVAGDYVASDGTQYWLRKSVTAATYTVVPAGPPKQSALPRLFRVQRVCPGWLALAGTGGVFSRLDWATAGSTLLLCVRHTTSVDTAATLAAPSLGDLASGCDGSAWLSLAKVTP
jgi:hypothetical protein